MAEAPTIGTPATARDLPAVAGCLASAFFDDPLWGRWTFPDDAERRRRLPALMTLMAEMGLAGRELTRMASGAGAVTIWTPPGARFGEPGFEERIEEVVGELLGARAPELHRLWEQFAEHEPTGSFHHLEWWATHRDFAGRGLGTELLGEDLTRVDAEGAPAYLESTNPVNIPRYEALGFEPVGAFGPTGGPTITTMWREAR